MPGVELSNSDHKVTALNLSYWSSYHIHIWGHGDRLVARVTLRRQINQEAECAGYQCVERRVLCETKPHTPPKHTCTTVMIVLGPRERHLQILFDSLGQAYKKRLEGD